jgi:hypothetical protein
MAVCKRNLLEGFLAQPRPPGASYGKTVYYYQEFTRKLLESHPESGSGILSLEAQPKKVNF